MKKLISLTLALILIVACLGTVSFADDVFAKVTAGGETVDVATLDDLWNAVEAKGADGKAVVKFVADLETTGQIPLPFSCTIDLDGHTVYANSGKSGSGNAFKISAAGSENVVTVIKNGVVKSFGMMAVRVDGGALQMENVIAYGGGGLAVGLYDANPAYSEFNHIKNCTLVSAAWGAIGTNKKDVDFSSTKMTIENTKLIATKESGSDVFTGNGNAGIFELGKGVEIYSYKADAYAAAKFTITGETAAMDAALATVEVPELSIKAPAMTKWATPEAPAEPEPTVPDTTTPDTTAPATGVSIAALGIMATISLAGAVISKKR